MADPTPSRKGLAWTPLTVGVLATAGRSLGFFPENFLTEHAMQIGSGLEAFILMLALADRIYREREDKIAAQADSLRKEKARNDAHDKLTKAMTHDPVTGLPDRNRFEQMVNQKLSTDPQGEYFVGVMRITRLDEINRTLGLNRSEKLIQRTARQMTDLAAALPSVQAIIDDRGREERVFQLSGDCFGLLIDSRRVHDDYESVNHALRKLADPVMMGNLAIELHPKFGAAFYPAHGENAAMLIRNAHVGMEIAPHSRYETGLYSSHYDIYSESRLTLMSDLREALKNDQTQVHYQPKICLKSGKVVGLEALTRWYHSERGCVYPSDFIPLAEETGLQALQRLCDSGLSLSIDDFGSGYSSLPYLKQLPATEIKLDRSLIMDVCTSDSSRVIVETAINMVHGLGYTVVAEGVENEESAELLKRLKCDRLQGFWLCHPLPLTELEQWLSNYQQPYSPSAESQF